MYDFLERYLNIAMRMARLQAPEAKAYQVTWTDSLESITLVDIENP